ncbi:sodium:alanine symporter family protein [Dehalococcoidia bacterium]|nr:sodium:alanine symporter family protein [Dehalococcoidia bacterium]
MEAIMAALDGVNAIAWGWPGMIIIVGGGLYLTFRLHGFQFVNFGRSFRMLRRRADPDVTDVTKGDVTPRQALFAATAATVGVGNIAGVATALAMGGPGAVFWMWITALVGMCTKAVEAMLGRHFRTINPDGSISGGPMYYLTKGLNLKWLGYMFAFFAALAAPGIGLMVQSNSISYALEFGFGVPRLATGIVIAILLGLVILGGIKIIARVASALVPFMCIFYIGVAVVVLIIKAPEIPAALGTIFVHAFTPTAPVGGFAGYAVACAMRFGVARGIFSNEAGLGSAPIVHAASTIKNPIHQGYLGIFEVFLDTIVVCTMTALVILTSGIYGTAEYFAAPVRLSGSPLTIAAFEATVGGLGSPLVGCALALLGFSTMLTWSYYGERSLCFITGERRAVHLFYRSLFVVLCVVGAVVVIDFVWLLTDTLNGLMLLPNMIAVVLLGGRAWKLVKEWSAEDILRPAPR